MKNRHLSARTGERVLWYSLLYGAIVILCLFFFLTWQTKNRAMTSLREILQVMERRITQYDLYMDNDQVKSLVRLMDKTAELSDRLAAALPEDVPAFLDRYAADQRLTGILVLDEYGPRLADGIRRGHLCLSSAHHPGGERLPYPPAEKARLSHRGLFRRAGL